MSSLYINIRDCSFAVNVSEEAKHTAEMFCRSKMMMTRSTTAEIRVLLLYFYFWLNLMTCCRTWNNLKQMVIILFGSYNGYLIYSYIGHYMQVLLSIMDL